MCGPALPSSLILEGDQVGEESQKREGTFRQNTRHWSWASQETPGLFCSFPFDDSFWNQLGLRVHSTSWKARGVPDVGLVLCDPVIASKPLNLRFVKGRGSTLSSA